MADYSKYETGLLSDDIYWLRQAKNKILRKYDAPRNPVELEDNRRDIVEPYSNWLDPYLTDNINDKTAWGDDADELKKIAKSVENAVKNFDWEK